MRAALDTLPPEAIRTMSGLELLRAMIAGQFPMPAMALTLNYRLVEADEGRAVFQGEPLETMLNPMRTVHGGWAATVLDSALACAVHATLKPGELYTSVEMKVNFLRPILHDRTGPLSCEGLVIHRGRTLALSEARLVDREGKIYAHGSETCMIFPAP